ncbi:Rhomboid family protein [Emticicia oligotrophica DSM 17448]|uniref:Rhomboid family protein n=1 Tax=Emticicia oligotrophica (strain DSM 17448 / CIP 109782 / MTCC 6937 / GPTSA100-15) TaxID=929562 RepID=A0ABM5N289_EMTOG|nr:rhomboid family intramembrane serine protease [Emticicia oligotrophica]AFK03456.1 Rhomboid family protein [Emticicia oligotrophica DSM 17448]
MASFIDDIKAPFKKGNTLIQLMLINTGVFLSLIIINFIFSFTPNGDRISELLSSNFDLIAPVKQFIRKPWTIVTYCFTHYGFLHLLFNMLTFFWFGTLVQEFIGSRKLLNIYLIGGILSGLFYITIYNLIALANQSGSLNLNNITPTILGASAAVYAVMFAAVALLPEYEFYLFGIVLIKIRYVAWFFLILSFIMPSSGISHLGGAISGYFYIYFLRRGVDLGSPIEAVSEWWGRLWRPKPKVKIPQRRYSETTVASKNSGGTNLDPNYFPDQDEVDAILDKIGKSGYESLTKEEKQKLYRASQKKD